MLGVTQSDLCFKIVVIVKIFKTVVKIKSNMKFTVFTTLMAVL